MTTGTNISEVMVTVYKDVFSKEPHYVKLSTVIERIRSGKSLGIVQKVRAGDSGIKTSLPSICFSGEFVGARSDNGLKKHSGLVILDFDKLTDVELQKLKESFKTNLNTVSAFVSPSGNGLKVLIRIADGSKHRQHYRALMRDFPTLDEKNINESRVCFESYDPDIYVNYDAKPYTKYLESSRTTVSEFKTDNEVFNNLVKWIEQKGKAYVSGSRNDFVFTLASACCRFGIAQEETEAIIEQKYLSGDTDFTVSEMRSTIRSAYKRNQFGSAEFTGERLVEKETLKEVELDDPDAPIADVIYGSDVFTDAKNIYHNGYISAESTGIPAIDERFRFKRGEISCLTGIGNHGKSTFLKFLMLNKTLADKTKWAVFGPEDFPAHEFYHDLTEMLIGANCTPENHDKPSEDGYDVAYRYITQHFFYIYPKDLSPTPEYIKSRFLKLILKEGVAGVIVDPFNQMANDYSTSNGRDDKYLETTLSDFKRFALANNVYFMIVAHPHKLRKENGEYPMPDVFDLAGGAMWNNKMDNILVYHRPNHSKDPLDMTCLFVSKKIRRQKQVGKPGEVEFKYNRVTRRFVFDVCELNKADLGYRPKQKQGYTRIAPIRNYSEPDHLDDTPF